MTIEKAMAILNEHGDRKHTKEEAQQILDMITEIARVDVAQLMRKIKRGEV
jgi:hypothetical protein